MLENSKVVAPWLVVLVVAVSAGSGCYDSGSENRDRPGGPLYEKWTASGDRVLVTDEAGETVGKFRRENTGWEVYDSRLRPVGEVRRDGRSERIVMRPTGGEATAIEPREGGEWAVGDEVLIRRRDRGWEIQKAGRSLGRVVRRDGTWELDGPSGDEPLEVSEEEGRLRRGDEVVRRTLGDDLPAPMLLLGTFDGLSPLERAAIGWWMAEGAPVDGSEGPDAGPG